MKRILFLLVAMGFFSSVNAQFWKQNFSSSSVVSDYISVTPNSGQFDAITQSVAAGTNGSLTISILSLNSI